MVDNTLRLIETKHPNKQADEAYKALVGLEEHKANLLNNLRLIIQPDTLNNWKKKHHKGKLPFLDKYIPIRPLVMLSGEVGCGKTALAHAIGSPLAQQLGTHLLTLETPSNIRGGGMVGEISNRITATFANAKAKIDKAKYPGILIIDEADDLATSRAQNQAHHEDRAGLNVLIKQIDLLSREKVPLAVIMITNRLDVLDPALRRRVGLALEFKRPDNEFILKKLFVTVLEGVNYKEGELKELIKIAQAKKPHFSYSDIIQRVGGQAILQSMARDKPLDIHIFKELLKSTVPSPLLENLKIV